MKRITNLAIVAITLLVCSLSYAQDNDCKLRIGTNLSGICDWMTEMPFVDMMHNARTWCTSNRYWIEGGVNEWNTNLIDSIERDVDGYPLEVPFFIDGIGLEDSQMVFAVWAWLEAWKPGVYTCLYDGEGDIDFNDTGVIISREPGRIEVSITPSSETYFLDLRILRSKRGNHVRNIRLLMPGHEENYTSHPFNPLFLEKVEPFAAIRFMDWGQTNNWGNDYFWTCDDSPEDTLLTQWEDRAKVPYYTWATNKGVPYEVMCDLCNTLNKDMWVCVPHSASDEYIREMARLIKGRLNKNLKVYAEYSNETWNWMFGQTQWLYTFYCLGRSIDWPEGIVDRVQNNLDLWTTEFADERERLVRVVGVQTAWQDVSNRIVLNLTKGSYDAIAITGYFGLSEQSDSILDLLGEEATVGDIARLVRSSRIENEATWIKSQYDNLASVAGVPVIYYEAGQHITPNPFGEEPSYANALLDIQRDTAMYNLYKEWYGIVENIIPEGEQTLYMNFSFIGTLSARYGSWGILETLDQDTTVIPAPKYSATLEQIRKCSFASVPLNLSVSDISIHNGTNRCFNALDTVSVAGITNVQFESGSSVDLIAGNTIRFLPGFHAFEGSITHAWITTDGAYCDWASGAIVENPQPAKSGDAGIIFPAGDGKDRGMELKVYPNPNNGRFSIELLKAEVKAEVKVYNALGERVYQSEVQDGQSIIDFTGARRGLYVVVVNDGKERESRKVMVE